MKRMIRNNNIYDVLSLDEFRDNPDFYCNNYNGMVAIEKDNHMYPIVKNPNDFGAYVSDAITIYNEPEDRSKYELTDAIDFSNITNMKELIEKNSMYRDMEYQYLVNPDNIFIPKITEKDSPEMRGLKQAVIDKNIDLDKYQSRFGDNYNNEKRLFNLNNITLLKLKKIANALDIKATLTLKDKSKDVANPMGTTIVVDLTGGEDDE